MPVAAAISTVEVLSFVPQSGRAGEMLAALAEAAADRGWAVRRAPQFTGGSDLLILWGPGAPNRFDPMRRQLAAGGHVVALDLAYWDRERKVRVSIDAAHPQLWVMRRSWPERRLLDDQVPIADAWNPHGPVVIAGLGDKARVQYGAAVVDDWEREMFMSARARADRPVLYRRKRPGSSVPNWATLTTDAPIDDVLVGASLLITWHSNVAVDAIRLGIPVLCRDGAAAAVSRSSFGPERPQPLSDVNRRRFLSNLAWFQWTPREAPAMLAWLSELLA